mgnify:CR=1 FL=1
MAMAFCAMVCLVPLASSVEKSSTPWHSTTSSSGKSSSQGGCRNETYGEKGEEVEVILELKLLADVGLLGFPNVGKSTFLSRVTDAKPKIANYHFTTIYPNLGVVKTEYGDSFVIADIPGLIEGASDGVGLGYEFLRHVERCRFLIHIVDITQDNPLENFKIINKELEKHSEALANRYQIVVLNKIDAIDEETKENYYKQFK